MINAKAVTSLVILLLILGTAGSAVAQKKSKADTPETINVAIPSMKYVAPDDIKIWEGEIGGRSVVWYRSESDKGISDVVVVTSNELPEYFKRIEYIDKGGEGDLDLVVMKIYENTRGWRDVGITKENKYGLGYADGQYKALLSRIKSLQEEGKK